MDLSGNLFTMDCEKAKQKCGCGNATAITKLLALGMGGACNRTCSFCESGAHQLRRPNHTLRRMSHARACRQQRP